MKKTSESYIQSECYIWLTNTYGLKHHNPRLVMFSVPNEIAMMIRGVLMETRLPSNKIDQIIAILTQRMKNTGLKGGASDTVIQFPNHVSFVEFKTETGYQSDKQKEFEQITTSLGNEYVIIRSIEEFKRFVNSKMNK